MLPQMLLMLFAHLAICGENPHTPNPENNADI